MEGTIDISVDFAGVRLVNPVFTASGTCGYADELADFMDVNSLGGFTTKSITLQPKKGNATPRIVETDSGMLNAIGWANIGLDKFTEEKLPGLEKLSCAVFVNIAGETIDEYVAMVQRLADEKAIAGFELNVSCPNVERGGISFGTMVVDVETRKPVLANKTGGLSGPAIKPIAVYLVNKVYNEVAKGRGIPILGMGGIRTASDAIEFIIAGASAIGVGTANFIEPGCAVKIIEGIKQYCARKEIANIKELVGSLEVS
jgi:dihydroorotate dehydrogenase (NAD+) catalytic subunit